jgi:hypothetical protein
LLDGIGRTRAAFYAAFHAGRPERPIARATLEKITGVAPRTQATYDVRLGVERTPNYALAGAEATAAARGTAHEFAWQHGRAAFRFCDRRGRHGPPGRTYLAHRLPNSYHAPYAAGARGRQRKINRRLRQDLVPNGTQGNSATRRRLFFDDGKAAAAQVGRGNGAFWRQRGGGSYGLWLAWLGQERQ